MNKNILLLFIGITLWGTGVATAAPARKVRCTITSISGNFDSTLPPNALTTSLIVDTEQQEMDDLKFGGADSFGEIGIGAPLKKVEVALPTDRPVDIIYKGELSGDGIASLMLKLTIAGAHSRIDWVRINVLNDFITSTATLNCVGVQPW